MGHVGNILALFVCSEDYKILWPKIICCLLKMMFYSITIIYQINRKCE